MSIYIEEAEIVSVGTKWDKGKSKKNKLSHIFIQMMVFNLKILQIL